MNRTHTHRDTNTNKHTVTRKFTFYLRTGLYFRTCEDGTGWHLIPCWISPRSEFFSRAYKNWHIMWGVNLWLDWSPLARGSKFHTIHTPTKATSLPPLEQWKIWTPRFRRNNINYSSRQFQFPVWYFKGIYRTILSEHIIRRIEAEKETWHNKFVADTTNNNFEHVGTLKYINPFYYTQIYTFNVSNIL